MQLKNNISIIFCCYQLQVKILFRNSHHSFAFIFDKFDKFIPVFEKIDRYCFSLLTTLF